MSEIMLGVLRMPADLFWADDPVLRQQHDAIRLEAAEEIERLQSELRDLSDCKERLARLGGISGCDHVDSPDDRARQVRCIEDAFEQLIAKADRLRGARCANERQGSCRGFRVAEAAERGEGWTDP